MKFYSKPYEIAAFQFKGIPTTVLNDDHDTCRIYQSMKGHFIRHPDGRMQKIDINDWIITDPFFKVMNDKRFKALFSKGEEQDD